MISIIDQLGSRFELVPLDVILKLAGVAPTLDERFLKNRQIFFLERLKAGYL